jgi:hypothetical protein
MTIISSQRYLDEEIVQAKRDAGDYVVTVSPWFEVCGEMVRVLIDGHHRHAAAIADGVEPIFVTEGRENDTVCLLLDGDVDAFLEQQYNDSDWYDISTGRTFF